MSSDIPQQASAVPVSLRYEIAAEDRPTLAELVESTGFFSPAEVDVAVELLDERLAKGEASGYYFVIAEAEGRMLGYSCFGPIPATAESWDLYWIVVRRSIQRTGLGRMLLSESERLIHAAGGSRVYVDTSSRPQYEPTRAFYERCGYHQAALLDDFYAPGDGKVIYLKRFDSLG